MFDSLLGRKFTAKCKYSIKCINSRITPIRRKKQAMLRFLKKDIADLLADGHDMNAYGRIEALIVEINLASCYDMIEQLCECILKQLRSLQKQRECTQEAMEAVSTLIFAAARFSDLPELCDLRRVFTARYGSHMEPFINTEFVANIQKKSFSLDKKMQLMRDIGKEFSINWDSKAFEHKIVNPSAHESDQPKQGGPRYNGNDEPSHMLHNGRKEAVINVGNLEIPSHGRFEPTPRVIVQKQEVQIETKDIHIISSTNNGRPLDPTKKTRKAFADEPENVEPYHTNVAIPPYLKPKGDKNGRHKEDQLSKVSAYNRSSRAQEELDLNGTEKQVVGAVNSTADKAINMVPPYTKPKGSKNGTQTEEQHDNGSAYNRSPRGLEGLEPIGQERQAIGPVNSNNGRAVNMIPPYVKPKVNNLAAHTDNTNSADPLVHGSAIAGCDRSNGGEDKDNMKKNLCSDDLTKNYLCGDEKPKPRSVRRKHPKPPVVNEIDSTIEDDKLEIRTPNGQRNGARRSTATYDDDCDEEEKVMDRLLIHYSKKGVVNSSKTRTRTKTTNDRSADAGEVVIQQSKDGAHPSPPDSAHPPERAVSLPPGPTSPTEVVKGPARATSMQPDLSSPRGGRVHPKLPDYDELAARFIALRKA